MSIPQDILKTVGDNPVEGAIAICRFALNLAQTSSDWTEEIHGRGPDQNPRHHQ